MLAAAERVALPGPRKILAEARHRTVDQHLIWPGACWDYLDAAWNAAGYPASRRRIIFRSSKRGPYADLRLLEPGDWLYLINRGYGGIEHSGMFIAWKDQRAKSAWLLAYAGEQRREPARYLAYDLAQVYEVTRAKD